MPCLADAPYDIVVFLLDDMRFDQVSVLSETATRLSDKWVQFDRAYVTTPMCCPERASFLSGGYPPWQTGVLTNAAPSGGATVFVDEHTLATRLQEAGATTALFGKYLNEYDALGAYVPPGWTVWAATGDAGGWTDFPVMVGHSEPSASATATLETVSGYVTDWQGAAAADLLRRGSDAPRFVYVSFLAPHHPSEPADEDEGAYAGTLYRERAYEEADVQDKPAWIRALPLLSADEQAEADARNQARLETLLSVDRAIASVVDAVQDAGNAQRTVFVLTSDNGQLWREHRLPGKGVAYEEAVRVPLLIAHPDLSPRSTAALVATNLDLAATVAALAGLSPEGAGQSLLPVLCDGQDTLRDAITLQGWEPDHPDWVALVTPDQKLIQTAGGEVELYNLELDPFEEESQHADPDQAATLAALAAQLEPGLAVSTAALPDATVGLAYDATLTRWGGEAPVTWAISAGVLPDGLTLDADGVLSGTPTAAGVATFTVQVTDASTSPVTGQPQRVSHTLTLQVLAAPPAPEDTAPPAPDTAALPKPEPCGCAAGGQPGAWAWILGLAALRRRR